MINPFRRFTMLREEIRLGLCSIFASGCRSVTYRVIATNKALLPDSATKALLRVRQLLIPSWVPDEAFLRDVSAVRVALIDD